MSDKNVVRLEAQLRLLRMIVKKGSRFVSTALSQVEVARVLGCPPAEVDRLAERWDLRPLRTDAQLFPVSQVQSFIAKRGR